MPRLTGRDASETAQRSTFPGYTLTVLVLRVPSLNKTFDQPQKSELPWLMVLSTRQTIRLTLKLFIPLISVALV